MDIFKLFFEHDLRLDKVAEPGHLQNGEPQMSLEDFMKPIPTYSKFYLTGTRIDREQFGLNVLNAFPKILSGLTQILGNQFIPSSDYNYSSLSVTIQEMPAGDVLIFSDSEDIPHSANDLQLDEDHSSIVTRKDALRETLSEGALVLYKEKAHHGFDIHLFSEENIYPSLFHTFKPMVNDAFRFFSINGKKIKSERQFYFETWRLERPPHGAEEVHPETLL